MSLANISLGHLKFNYTPLRSLELLVRHMYVYVTALILVTNNAPFHVKSNVFFKSKLSKVDIRPDIEQNIRLFRQSVGCIFSQTGY